MKQNKICLITPPSNFLLDERVFMNLGVLSVAAALEQAGWHVDHIDLSGISNYLDVVADYAKNSSMPFFGITATTAQLPAAAQIADVLHEHTSARVILGGPHATLAYAAVKKELERSVTARAHRSLEHLQAHFDVLVAGDGERAIFLACQPDAPAIIDADDRKSDLFLKDADFNVAPFPARHLVDVESYRYQVDGVPALSLIAQLGCPFNCGFCAGRNSSMLRHIRKRSSAQIVAEMVHLHKTYGHTGFMFYDDELNVNPKIVELMEMIKVAQDKRNVEWRLRGFIKAELFDERQAATMYAAGFRQILVGFESGSPRILDNIQKKATRDDNSRCVEIAHAHGLTVKALMSIGHPGESAQTVAETKQWLLDAKPDDFDVTIITPYPGSPYYDDAVYDDQSGSWVYRCANGDTLFQQDLDYTTVADYYKGDPEDGYVSHVHTPDLTAEELVAGRNDIESSVRQALGIPFYSSAAAIAYEHSMGQSPSRTLPSNILRQSA